MGRTRFLLALDLSLLLLVIALQAVSLTGLVAHEWIGIGIAVPLLVHLMFQWQWIMATWRRAMAQQQRRGQVNFLLNSLLFVLMTVAIFSGVVASEIVAPGLRLSAGRHTAWSELHGVMTNTLVGLVGLHVALNWRLIASGVRVHVLQSISRPAGLTESVALNTDPEDG